MGNFQVDAVKSLMIMSLALVLLAPSVVAEGDSETQSAEAQPCYVYHFKKGLIPIAIDPYGCIQKKVEQILSWPPGNGG